MDSIMVYDPKKVSQFNTCVPGTAKQALKNMWFTNKELDFFHGKNDEPFDSCLHQPFRQTKFYSAQIVDGNDHISVEKWCFFGYPWCK